MLRKICIIPFLLVVWLNLAYAQETGLGDGISVVSAARFSKSSQDQKDVFDIWSPEESELKYRKSITKAVFLSLVLPGTGEYYADSRRKGHIFMGTDMALWIGFVGLRSYGSWLKRDYRIYAAQHAGIDLSGKQDDFFEDLTYYESRDEYNQFAPLYSNGELLPYPQTDFWDWQWEDIASRYYYRDLRNKSKLAYRKSLFVAGLLLVNRIISAVDAARVVKEYNRKKNLQISSVKIDLQANPWTGNPYFRFTLTKSF